MHPPCVRTLPQMRVVIEEASIPAFSRPERSDWTNFNCNRMPPVIKGFAKTSYGFCFLYFERWFACYVGDVVRETL